MCMAHSYAGRRVKRALIKTWYAPVSGCRTADTTFFACHSSPSRPLPAVIFPCLKSSSSALELQRQSIVSIFSLEQHRSLRLVYDATLPS